MIPDVNVYIFRFFFLLCRVTGNIWAFGFGLETIWCLFKDLRHMCLLSNTKQRNASTVNHQQVNHDLF